MSATDLALRHMTEFPCAGEVARCTGAVSAVLLGTAAERGGTIKAARGQRSAKSE